MAPPEPLALTGYRSKSETSPATGWAGLNKSVTLRNLDLQQRQQLKAGPVIAMLTFPGVIIHEAAHLFFCKLFKLQVYGVCFLQIGNPAVYVRPAGED